jgi:hypothetical protein
MALTQVSTDGVKDGSLLNADINASAAIAGSKISADFGTQNITSAGKLRLNPNDNSTTWQRENKNLHQIRDDVYVEGTVNVGDKAGFDFTPLAISAFSYSGTTLTLTTASHTIAVGDNILIKDSASGFQEAFNTISGTTGTTVKVTRSSDPSSSLSTANTKVIVYTPADPRGCINVAKDHDKFDQNTFNPILRGYVGKDLDTAAGRNTEAFKIELKKDSSATDHVATLLHSTKEFGNGQRLALTIDDGNSYPDGKNLVLTQNGVKITADDSAFTDSDELLEVEGNAKIDGNLEVTGTLSAGGDGTISGDELFLTDSIKHVGDTDTSISFPSNDTIRFRTAGAARLDIDSNGNVGIGTTTPDQLGAGSDSTILAVIESSGTRRGQLLLGDNQNVDTGGIGDIHFVGKYQNSGHKDMACIKAQAAGSTSGQRGAVLIFETKTDGTAAIAERMRIDSSGRVMIGTTSTSGISGSADDIIIGSIGDSTSRGITFATTTDGTIRWADAGDNAMGRIQYLNNTDVMTFHTSNAPRLRLDSDGMKFGSDTAAANALDDYEEGTWTPNIRNNGATATWTTQQGRYVKIGQQVTVWFNADGGTAPRSGGGSGELIMTGLPFSQSIFGNPILGIIGANNNVSSGLYSTVGLILNIFGQGGTQVRLGVGGQSANFGINYAAGSFTYTAA